ncbi:mechanosensitive ion channel family protein [Leptolyngbya sp. 7M]|uniref:mechanosensitive ion channel family protein n=1 Tax=Leptolyngbya sp. 7M TaxID=2812896 RepID=UPI001B8C563E|nr:substrate-binding domain-containing protein [Leptolyngbya sp. 7M]QYO65170.1 substrate-binding domain-containing protein [Leptolyngbya sp. 7M]
MNSIWCVTCGLGPARAQLPPTLAQANPIEVTVNTTGQFLSSLAAFLPNLLGAIAILIIGWLVALIVAAVVQGLLKRTDFDNRIAAWAGGGRGAENRIPIEKWIGTAVFWLIMAFVLVAFFNALQLTAVSAPHPENTWAQTLTVSELKKMWEPVAQGKITNWNQIRPDFPDRPLKLYGAGTDSGTYDYFAEVITGGSDLRPDFPSSEDDDVLVQGVASDPNALGFFGFSYFERNQDKLKAVAVQDDIQAQANQAVAPSREAVENATYVPLSRPLFIYVNGRASQQNVNLRDFVTFYMVNAQQIVESVNYIPMPGDAYEIGAVHLYKGEYGTAYEGKPQPYLTIKEVLQKEQSL